MHPQLETLFDDAENRYLKPEELSILNQYVQSLPVRLKTYNSLRENEVTVMQPVADQLTAAYPNEPTKTLERSLKNALLVLRYCAMAMLLDDEQFVHDRLLSWLKETLRVYNTRKIDQTLYQLLEQQLAQVLSPEALALLTPLLATARQFVLNASQEVPA